MPTREELKTALDAAIENRRDAENNERLARAALADFDLANSGLSGHAVEYTRKTWKSIRTIRFIVDRVKHGDWLEGRIIKQDGTIGTRAGYCSAGVATDLGPYVAPGSAEGSSHV